MAKTETQLNDHEHLNSREIEAEIERTRAEMDQTVNALVRKLSPQHLLNDVLSVFNVEDGSRQLEDNAKTVGKWFLRGIGQYPLPSMVIGAGLAWLIIDIKNKRAETREKVDRFEDDEISGVLNMSNEPQFEKSTSPGMRDEMGLEFEINECGCSEPGDLSAETEIAKGKGRVADAAARVKSKASQVAGEVSQCSRENIEKLSRATQHTTESAARGARAAREELKHGVERVRSGVERGRERATEVVDDYPLIVGISAMAVGLLIGLSIPSTRRERRAIGAKASQWRQQAEELVERGKEVARTTAEAIKDEAQRQGLTPAGIKESICQVAKSASSTAQEEGITAEGLVDKVEMVAEEAVETVKDEIRGREDERPV